MKKLSWYFIALLLSSLFLSSCGDDDEPASIEGTWVIQNQELEVLLNGVPISNELLETFGLDTEALEIPEGSTLELAAGGQLTATQPGAPVSTGTWNLSDDGRTLTLTLGSFPQEFEVVELTQQNLNLKISQTEQAEQDGLPIEITVEVTLFGTRQ